MSSNESALKYKNLGNACFEAGKFREAIDYYTQAIEQDASNSVYFSNRSASYSLIGMFEEALADAERAIVLRPNWNKPYLRKGRSLAGLHRFQEAIEALQIGLKVDANDPGNSSLAEELKIIKEHMAELQAEQIKSSPTSETSTLSREKTKDDESFDPSEEVELRSYAKRRSEQSQRRPLYVYLGIGVAAITSAVMFWKKSVPGND